MRKVIPQANTTTQTIIRTIPIVQAQNRPNRDQRTPEMARAIRAITAGRR